MITIENSESVGLYIHDAEKNSFCIKGYEDTPFVIISVTFDEDDEGDQCVMNIELDFMEKDVSQEELNEIKPRVGDSIVQAMELWVKENAG